MAMLAEPRQRKRYNLVPRGKALYEDGNRFGTKMLEKMGWSKDKGLGANEDGSKEFVRVRYKNDANGFGYEERDDQWTQHEESFTGLLKSLHNGEDEKNEFNNDDVAMPTKGFGFQSEPKKSKEKLKDKFSGESLEQKSKNSKARVHYKKFTRGKDLSRYSETDLANIFGKKVDKDKTTNGIYEQFNAFTLEQDDGEEKAEETSNFAGVPTINTGLSVSDYFKMKMEVLKNKTRAMENKEQEPILAIECNDGSKRNKKQKRPTEDEVTAIEELEQEAPKKKKKRKEEPYVLQENNELKEIPPAHFSNTNSEKDSENIIEGIKTKKKKKSKKSEKNITSATEQTQEETNALLGVKCNQDTTEELKTQKKHLVSTNSPLETNSEKNSNKIVGEVIKIKKQKKSKKSEKITDKVVTEEINDDTNALLGVSHTFTAMSNNPDITTESKTNKMQNSVSTNSPLDMNISQTDYLSDDRSAKEIKSTKHKSNITENSEALNEIENSSKKHDVSEYPSSKIDIEALKSQLDSFNTYSISSFCAEKFRNVDLNRFTGSSMSQIIGYSFSHDLKLNIKVSKSDEQRILQFWNCTLNKYKSDKPKKSKYNQYLHEAHAARKFRKKVPDLLLKSYKRQQVFNGL